MLNHICGQCTKTFTSEAAYLRHQCQTTGHTPKQPQHLDPAPHSTKSTEKQLLAAVSAIRRSKKHG